LANGLTRSLRELTKATQSLAAGKLGQQVPVRSQDELGELAAAFNQMSADLARAREIRQQMTADIAHELRTPLSIILGHAEALSEGALPPEAETFRIIHDEARQLNRLVEDLRTLSLSDAGELSLVREPVEPGALLERVANSYASLAGEKEIALRVNAAPELSPIYVDLERMVQVFSNLLDNAIRYTPKGGVVELSANLDGESMVFKIKDSGSGIPPEELPLIFNRFYRLDKARQRAEGGTGLGLAIAKSIVENHGGQIAVESEVGRGVTFIVTLPGVTFGKLLPSATG